MSSNAPRDRKELEKMRRAFRRMAAKVEKTKRKKPQPVLARPRSTLDPLVWD
jgi:hypothetical protein